MSTPFSFPPHWEAFLEALDHVLTEPSEIICIGGFALEVGYGSPRSTSDLDAIEIRPLTAARVLLENAGPGTELSRKHHLYLHSTAGTCDLPEGFESRLIEIAAGRFRNLHIFIPELYDLILTKMQRNTEKDRADFLYLIRRFPFDPRTLRERCEKNLAPYLLNTRWIRLTLDLWLEIAAEAHPS